MKSKTFIVRIPCEENFVLWFTEKRHALTVAKVFRECGKNIHAFRLN